MGPDVKVGQVCPSFEVPAIGAGDCGRAAVGGAANGGPRREGIDGSGSDMVWRQRVRGTGLYLLGPITRGVRTNRVAGIVEKWVWGCESRGK